MFPTVTPEEKQQIGYGVVQKPIGLGKEKSDDGPAQGIVPNKSSASAELSRQLPKRKSESRQMRQKITWSFQSLGNNRGYKGNYTSEPKPLERQKNIKG